MENQLLPMLPTVIAFVLGLIIGLYFSKIKNRIPKPPVYQSDDMKMVLLVRTDLGMGKGKVAAQCCHACLAAYQSAQKQSKDTQQWLEAWENEGCAKITLKCPDESTLYLLLI